MALLLTERWRNLYQAYNPSDVGLGDYRAMEQRSVPVRVASDFLTRGAVRRLGEYTHPNPRIEEWVRDNVWKAALKGVSGMLGAVYYGAMLAEPALELRGGALRLAAVDVADPDLWWLGRPRYEGRDLVGWRTFESADVPFYSEGGLRQVYHWQRGSRWGSPFGDPAARRAWPSYNSLRECIINESIALDVAAITRLLVCGTSGEQSTQELADLVQHLGTNGVAVVPGIDPADVVQITGSMTGSGPYDTAIRRHMVMAFWAFGVPPLLLIEAQFGTRAQSSTQLEAYEAVETVTAEDAADEVLRDQIIGPLVWAQFGDPDPGDIPIRPFSPPDVSQWATVVSQLSLGGWMDPENPVQRSEVEDKIGIDLTTGWQPESLDTPAAETRPAAGWPGAGEPVADTADVPDGEEVPAP